MGIALRILVVAAVVALWTLAAWKWGRWRGGCGCCGQLPGRCPPDDPCADKAEPDDRTDADR